MKVIHEAKMNELQNRLAILKIRLEKDKQEKGISIKLKNGNIDYYDPCDKIIIDNGTCQYKIKADDIESIGVYEIEP